MFKIDPINSLPEGVNLLLRGAQLADWDMPQFFILTSEVVQDPFYISVTFSKDDDNKESKIDVGNIAGNRMNINLVNPHSFLPTATKQRMPLLSLAKENVQLTMAMVILSPSECQSVVFYYEFYEEPIEQLLQSPIQKEHLEGL